MGRPVVTPPSSLYAIQVPSSESYAIARSCFDSAALAALAALAVLAVLAVLAALAVLAVLGPTRRFSLMMYSLLLQAQIQQLLKQYFEAYLLLKYLSFLN